MPYGNWPLRIRTRLLITLLTVAAAVVLAATPRGLAQGNRSIPATGDEFVGPFSSWANARTDYGAVGDGLADDTAALQRGLSAIREDGHAPVLFLPAGTYRITATLVLAYGINLSVVGEHPERVRIVWDGPAGGRMLWVNGVAYSRVSRLTFDGRQRASEAVAQSLDDTGGHFDTGNEYADDTFVDVEYGIRGGFLSGGFAETSVVRARFLRNTKAGIAIGNFNALDLWVWDSLFDHCDVGVTNVPGAGNYRVYDSVFRASRVADLVMQNTGLFSARSNYSEGSAAFYVSGRAMNHPANIDIQRNVIVDTTESTAIRMGNQGPGLVLDNIIRSRPDAASPVIMWRSPVGSDLVTVGNTFTVPDPISVNGRRLSIDDRVVPADRIRISAPTLPPPQASLNREVFDVPSGSNTRTIQAIINSAAAKRGTRPVVHFPFGVFDITETLTVPASDIQLVGDGYNTVLKWRGGSSGPVLRLGAPTRVTVRELTIEGTPAVDGLAAYDIDTPQSRVRLDGVQLRSGDESNLLVDGLDHVDIDITDVGHAYSPRGASVKIVGGPAARGIETAGRTTIYSGASSDNGLSYDISAGARVLLQDLWYEAQKPGFARIRGGAAVTMQGLRVATAIDANTPAFVVDNPGGRVSLLNMHLDDRIAVSGQGASSLLGIGIVREHQTSDYFSTTSSPAPRVGLINTRQRVLTQGLLSPGTLPLPNIGATDPAFVRDMLSETRRSAPPVLKALPSAASDLRLFRVWISNGRNNLVLGRQRFTGPAAGR